ncbi:abhydrolase domain-containing protein [Verticillium alfalfae VaMs.102]|uniref:Abhydrolase domain-containing protein n=2 Tax=Verticillium TaxID=1036719 RepID=C9S8D7_VERA1|nr:abhydrolase domain-containing protein [Verticillium alfalfae VaMs.102]EEY14916.1 abhydrolase domain-containing protein [Verticillium alfalfae VaMs.102]
MIQHHSASAVVHGSRLTFAAASSIVGTTTTSTSTIRAPTIDELAQQRKIQRRTHQTMATAQQKTVDDKAKPSRPNFAYFPLGYKEAAYQWWSSISPSTAERNVLAHIPYLKDAREHATIDPADQSDPFGPRVWKTQMVNLSGQNRALNEYSVERVGEKVEENLVMLHGYGAGLGFYYKNFEPLSRRKGWKLYALDMLGMGNSTRPPFKMHAKDKQGKIDEAEAWFVDALEEWRKARNIDKFTLIGHSLGGYLSVAYALKYPGHLKKLILASPVGVPSDPYAVNEAMPEPGSSTLENEFTQDQESVVNDTHNHANASVKSATATNSSNAPKRPLPGWFAWLWDANVSPFSVVRFSGPLGPRIVSGWTSRRFNHLPTAEALSLHDYAFSVFRQKGSGEYALPYILAPGAYARSPIIDRIEGVGRQTVEKNGQKIKETGIPIVMMYGENDWMDVAGGLASEEKLKAAKRRALLEGTAEEKRRENGSARVIVVQKAGHHLYLDNADDFNEYIWKEMDETRSHSQKGLA